MVTGQVFLSLLFLFLSCTVFPVSVSQCVHKAVWTGHVCHQESATVTLDLWGITVLLSAAATNTATVLVLTNQTFAWSATITPLWVLKLKHLQILFSHIHRGDDYVFPPLQGKHCEKCKPLFVGSAKGGGTCRPCREFCRGNSAVCLSRDEHKKALENPRLFPLDPNSVSICHLCDFPWLSV